MEISVLKKNYLYTLIRVFSSFLFPLITFPYVFRVLGPDKIGLVEYMMSIAQYGALIAMLGTSTYAIREIGKIKDNPAILKKTFSEIFFLRIFNSLIIGLILFALLKYLKVSSYLLQVTLLYMILQIGVVDWLFQGIENVKSITIRILISKSLVLILIFLFVKTEDDYLLYILFMAIDASASLIYGIFYVAKNIGFTFYNLEFKKHIKPLLFLFAVQFSISVYTLVDKIMLGAISSNAEVGYYSTALKIVSMLQSIIASLRFVVLPRLSYYIKNENFKDFKVLVNKTLNFILFISMPLVFGLYIISEESILLFAGDQFANSIILTKILAVTILLTSFGNLYGTQILVSIDREKEFSIVVFSGAALNILLNIILIPEYSSLGASIATILTEILVAAGCTYFAYRYCKVLPLPKLKTVLTYFIVASFFLVIGQIKMYEGLIFTFLIKVLLSMILYFGALYMLKDRFFMELLQMARKKIKV